MWLFESYFDHIMRGKEGRTVGSFGVTLLLAGLEIRNILFNAKNNSTSKDKMRESFVLEILSVGPRELELDAFFLERTARA